MWSTSKIHNGLRRTLIVISWIPVAMTVNEHICYVAKIEGSSMRPTLNPNETIPSDWVLLWKWGVQDAMNLRYNDVILFKAPYNPTKVYCKRIKGVQFDSVSTNYPYPREIVQIPRNHVWVEGDNTFHSIDSNTFGPISTGLVLGKVAMVLWPPSRWGSQIDQSGGRGDIRVRDMRF
ncbi:LAMI_0D01090g1_1 [Lachancea mirantina]|uniref:Mitochondrial inner membrane protease subunit 2 n=1 Tax=Lachancea mirantina TaxID=1230905 RepID=A0A1G4J8U3_9SACH|nr:LAMI_0D01090g1_1 [Lachancea mirantina]